MRNVREAIIQMIKQVIDWMYRRKTAILPLAMIVTVVTVYSLVMPAFTLEKEEAEKQGGIDVPGVEQLNEEQSSEEEPASEEGQAAIEEKASKEEDRVSDEKQLITKKTELTSDGTDYSVSVMVNKNAELPEDTKLQVSEIKEKKDGAKGNAADGKDPAAEDKEGRDYNELYQKAEKALKSKYGSSEIGSVKFYDISLMSGETAVEPSSDVDVTIKLDDIDAKDASDYRILHFTEDGPVVLDSETNDKEISFKTDGFSVYAVVGGEDPKARMTLKFYSKGELIDTIYVKNDDTLAELEEILYDPGAGDLDVGESFTGWILDNPDYTTADLSSTLTIKQVREWAESETITEGETHRLDAAVCKLYHITYKDLDGTVLGKDAVAVKSSDYGTASVTSIVKMAYTPKDDVHKFEGWTLDADCVSNVTSTIPEGRNYKNDDNISIKGDISFTVNAPEGNWLIFDENGKGGKYNAPQFVKSGETTERPCLDADMTRRGYRFGGWYSEVTGDPDAHGYRQVVESSRFTFGRTLTEKTTLYAKWIPNETAPYTVILWGQKLNEAGTDVTNKYDVLGSYVGNGRVNTNIPYTSVDNGSEDYATGVGAGNGHYTGFNLTEASKNQQITITPEGDAVLNLYYDRILYNFKFYLYRTANQNNRYDYANGSGNGSTLNDIVTWHSNQDQHPDITGYDVVSESVGGRTYYYFVLSAYYGQDISADWPKYNQIIGANGRDAVSFVMMVGTKLKPRPTNQGSGTVKGVITIMDENILGATNDANGNYVFIRFPGSYYNWRYHIWLETVPGEDYSDYNTYTYEGKTYYEVTVQTVRSSNTDEVNQNEPTYHGFDYQLRVGQNRQGVWEASSTIRNVDANNHKVGEHWNTDQNGNWANHSDTSTNLLYHMNYIYNRQVYKISYFDGNYVDGSGRQIQNRASQLFKESAEIAQGAIIPQADRDYVPTPEEDGYEFAGWYIDEACTVPYTWSTMPIGGIVVYAKWIQKEYRVFMHPNADRDPNLSWGSSTVSMSFRVSYGGKVSLPRGTREGSGYEFVGWYTDPSLGGDYLYNGDTILNEETVTTPYDKTEPTELDKWGDSTSNINKDAQENRFWVNKKLDLYAKWRKILEGDGAINVVYTADDGNGHVGSHAPVDDSDYPDVAEARAQSACLPPDDMYFKYWVVQKWDPNADEGQGAYVDTEINLLPGQKFIVNEAYAHKQADPEHPGQFTYTMQLRAEYGEPESGLPTHIWWFNNYSNTGASRHDSSRQDEGIKINEAVLIQGAPTRDGYKFLGWARVPVTESHSASGVPPTGDVLDDLDEDDLYLKYEEDGSFTLVDPTSTYDGATVTQVAADERQPYHDMYAVWEKIYKVKVVKTVVSGMDSDKQKDFTFTPGGALGTTGFTLKDSEETDDYLVNKNEGISVEEAAYSDFNTSIAVTDYEGNPVTSEHIHIDGRKITVDKVKDDMVITYTNTRKGYNVRFVKVDDKDSPLSGATFTLAYKETESGSYGDATEFNIGSKDLQLVAGYYELTEINAPDYYVIMKDKAHFHVAADGTITLEPNEYVTVTPETGLIKYIIKIKNVPGEELPVTGGIGTTILYIAGAILTMISGILLVIRAKQKLN